MKNFEYAHPRTESDAVAMLSARDMSTAVLAGGTDLIGLMKRMVVEPDRVVNVSDITSLQHIEQDVSGGIWIGAAVRLDEFLDDSVCDSLAAVKQTNDS